jgi:hypothetical protein
MFLFFDAFNCRGIGDAGFLGCTSLVSYSYLMRALFDAFLFGSWLLICFDSQGGRLRRQLSFHVWCTSVMVCFCTVARNWVVVLADPSIKASFCSIFLFRCFRTSGRGCRRMALHCWIWVSIPVSTQQTTEQCSCSLLSARCSLLLSMAGCSG